MKKKPYHPSILKGLKEQLEDQFQMSEGHVLEYKGLKAQTNIEVPNHIKPCKHQNFKINPKTNRKSMQRLQDRCNMISHSSSSKDSSSRVLHYLLFV